MECDLSDTITGGPTSLG